MGMEKMDFSLRVWFGPSTDATIWACDMPSIAKLRSFAQFEKKLMGWILHGESVTRKTFISIGECMAELQLVRDGLYSLGFGGDTLNTAWYVKALTVPDEVAVDYLTSVGGDQLSQDLLAFLKTHKIGTRFVQEVSGRNLGLYLITLQGSERSFTYWRNASAARLLAEDESRLRSALAQADVIYFSGITLAILESGHRQIFLNVLAEMKRRGVMIAFDSNVRRKLWPSDHAMKVAMIAGYRAATLALPTFDDDCALFGDATPSHCARRIAAYGINEIIVKDGSRPCLVSVNGSMSTVSPDPIEKIVDTTGAGDSFNAGYLAARMSGKEPLAAAKLAHRVAGRVICSRGALADMASFSDLIVNGQ
jgi:2-dehydro-3-deoxygluconokinase